MRDFAQGCLVVYVLGMIVGIISSIVDVPFYIPLVVWLTELCLLVKMHTGHDTAM